MNWWRRLLASRSELEREDLRTLLQEVPASPIAAARPRSLITVAGTITALTFPTDGAGLSARLDDGTGAITLKFLGRRSVGGISLGRRLIATGMVAQNNELLMVNPDYTLLPGIAE